MKRVLVSLLCAVVALAVLTGAKRVKPPKNTASTTLPDTSCLAVSNSQTGNGQMAGTLIDPNSAIFVAHFRPALGTVFHWRGVDGVIYSSTLIAGGNVEGADLFVGNFSPALPPAVRPAPIVAAPVGSAVQINQFRQLINCRITSVNSTYVYWDRAFIDKDSGSPVLVNSGGVTAVVALAKTAYYGPTLAAKAAEIAALGQ